MTDQPQRTTAATTGGGLDQRSQDVSRALAEASVEAERKQLDETVEGGKYLASDGKTLVNANGEPLKDRGD